MPICFVVHLFITIVNDGYLSWVFFFRPTDPNFSFKNPSGNNFSNRYGLRLHFLTGLRSLGLRQSAVINVHPDCSGTLHRILNAGVPDPFFPTPTQKKKAVWLREANHCHSNKHSVCTTADKAGH